MNVIFDSSPDFEKVALTHARNYPGMRAQDFIKLAYQHAKGCEHLVRESPDIERRIQEERSENETGVRFEALGNGLVRTYLSGTDAHFSSALVSRMFSQTARAFSPREGDLEKALSVLLDLAKKELLPVSFLEMSELIEKYRDMGSPAVRHSPEYRALYAPAYRVTLSVFSEYCQLFEALEALARRKPSAIVAIDGMCASGKSTLANTLASTMDALVLHMDDFFLPPEMRTPERLSEPGGNVHRERFLTEALTPLSEGKPFSYRPYSCQTQSFASPVCVRPARLNIVEGAYSCHPELSPYYDMTACLTVDPALQAQRIRLRDGETAFSRFQNEWIPMENRYLSHFRISDRADFAYCVFPETDRR